MRSPWASPRGRPEPHQEVSLSLTKRSPWASPRGYPASILSPHVTSCLLSVMEMLYSLVPLVELYGEADDLVLRYVKRLHHLSRLQNPVLCIEVPPPFHLIWSQDTHTKQPSTVAHQLNSADLCQHTVLLQYWTRCKTHTYSMSKGIKVMLSFAHL